MAQLVKNPPAMWETCSLEDPLEKGKATHASILAWRIPWTVSMESQSVGHGATFTETCVRNVPEGQDRVTGVGITQWSFLSLVQYL